MAIAAVQALDVMLKSKERREQTRLSNALSMMQFAQERKMQNYQLAGQQLQMLLVNNQQQMQSTAVDFMGRTGFMRHYVSTTDVDDKADAIKEFYEVLTHDKGQYRFSHEDADRIVGAVWTYGDDANNIRPTIQLAADLKRLMDADEQTTLSVGFLQTPLFDDIESADLIIGGAIKALENERLIRKEMYEYGKGDPVIQSDISPYELPPAMATVGGEEDVDDDEEKNIRDALIAAEKNPVQQALDVLSAHESELNELVNQASIWERFRGEGLTITPEDVSENLARQDSLRILIKEAEDNVEYTQDVMEELPAVQELQELQMPTSDVNIAYILKRIKANEERDRALRKLKGDTEGGLYAHPSSAQQFAEPKE